MCVCARVCLCAFARVHVLFARLGARVRVCFSNSQRLDLPSWFSHPQPCSRPDLVLVSMDVPGRLVSLPGVGRALLHCAECPCLSLHFWHCTCSCGPPAIVVILYTISLASASGCSCLGSVSRQRPKVRKKKKKTTRGQTCATQAHSAETDM